MIKTQLAKHLNHLVVEIGARPAGSPANHATAAYVKEVFEVAGLEVEKQRYDCPAWQSGETWLALDKERLEAVANAYSPPCDVVAPLVPVCTVAELEAAELDGRIGLLYGDLTKAPLGCKSWFLTDERDAHIVGVLEEKEPAALITVQAKPGSLERIIEDWEFTIPSATVGTEVGLALLRQSEQKVHLHIESEQSPGRSSNIVGRKGPADGPKIVLCAHYDTKVGTPGATDNGSGTAALLALAQLLSQKDLALGLECVAFTGHEYLPLGDDEYVRRGEAQFSQIVAAINFDFVGNALGAGSIASFTCAERFQNHLNELVDRIPGIMWVEPWPQSNHSTFAWRGVPSLAFASVVGNNITHQRIDTVEWVSPAKLAETVSLAAGIVELLQDKSPTWTRPPEQLDNEQ